MTRQKMTVFLLHHAGGNKYAYNIFKTLFPSHIHLVLYELPGRGARMNEPLIKDIDALVDDIYSHIASRLNTPYVFLGHSMGSVLAYLLTKKIIRENRQPPLSLFLSGRVGPSYFEDGHVRKSALPGQEFIAVLKDLGGIPQEILDDEVSMDFFEPIIRADFEVLENYRYVPGNKLNVPIHVLLGTDDHTAKKEAILWQDVTTLPVDIHYFEGGHFFIFDKAKEVAAMVAAQAALMV
jgi:surfactin synthase thioesterase subunit